jgi:hypothetical protein
MTEKYSIIADTSVLFPQEYKNYNYLEINKELYDFVSFIRGNSALRHINILIPRIVVRELLKQQIESYNKNIERIRVILSKLSELPGFELQIPEFDYVELINKRLTNFLTKYKIGIIEVPEGDVTNKLVEKVINKDKPFYKKGTDSGFKDAVIWESILEYVKHHQDEHIIFWCGDKDFHSDKLIKEFTDITRMRFIHFPNSAELKVFLDSEYELHKNFKLILNKVDDEFFRMVSSELEKYRRVYIDATVFNIRRTRIKSDIMDINFDKERDSYILSIPLVVTHETPYSGYGVVDKIYEQHEEANLHIPLLIEVKLELNKIKIIDIRPGIDILQS